MAAFAIAGAALALSATGAYMSYKGAKAQAGYQQQILAQEQAAEAARKRAMELEARRRQLEMVRTQQRVRAMALATTTAQGASTGSALGGAYGQASGQTGTNLLGVQQNLEIGRQIFGINAGITQSRIGMAGAATTSALGSGLSSLGGALLTSAQPVTSMYRSAFGGQANGTLTSTNFGNTGHPSYPMYR